MILLNVTEELYVTAKVLNHTSKTELYEDMNKNLNKIMALQEGNRIVEYKATNSEGAQSLIARHVNPGHTLESIWFMMHSLDHLHVEDRGEYISILERLAGHAFDLGWDNQYGGLLRFVDKDGGTPKGNKIDTPIENLIIETWDTKLWWPHSEALYTTLLMAIKTEQKSLARTL